MLAGLLKDAKPEYVERTVRCLVLLAATLGPMAKKIAQDPEFMHAIWEIIRARRADGESALPTEKELAAAAASAAAEAAAAAAAAATAGGKGGKGAAPDKKKDAPAQDAPPGDEPPAPPPPPPPEEVVKCKYPPSILEGALRVRAFARGDLWQAAVAAAAKVQLVATAVLLTRVSPQPRGPQVLNTMAALSGMTAQQIYERNLEPLVELLFHTAPRVVATVATLLRRLCSRRTALQAFSHQMLFAPGISEGLHCDVDATFIGALLRHAHLAEVSAHCPDSFPAWSCIDCEGRKPEPHAASPSAPTACARLCEAACTGGTSSVPILVGCGVPRILLMRAISSPSSDVQASLRALLMFCCVVVSLHYGPHLVRRPVARFPADCRSGRADEPGRGFVLRGGDCRCTRRVHHQLDLHEAPRPSACTATETRT